MLLDVELAAGAVLSILKDSDLKRSRALPVDEALALSLQGVASVSSHILSYLILLNVDLVLGTDFTLDVAGGYSFEGFGQKSQTKQRPR